MQSLDETQRLRDLIARLGEAVIERVEQLAMDLEVDEYPDWVMTVGQDEIRTIIRDHLSEADTTSPSGPPPAG